MNQKTCFILDKDKNVVPATIKEWIKWGTEKSILFQDMYHGLYISTRLFGFDDERPLKTEVYLSCDECINGSPPINYWLSKTYSEAITKHQLGMQWAKEFKLSS